MGTDAAGSGLRTSDFSYDLPQDRVARFPADRRDHSRLLVLEREADRLEDRRFDHLAERIPPGDALVLNDTRVLPARLLGRKPTGAAGEVLLLRALDEEGRRWKALVRPGAKLKPGRALVVADDLTVHVLDSTEDGGRVVLLEGDAPPRALLERHGRMPIPPYLDRESVPLDRERYQTVYARREGSVAAPTAGLHFTGRLLDRIAGRGVVIERVTLHVGVGTFRPVAAERPEDHGLHEERYEVSPSTARALNRVRRDGGRIWAVGTTTTRTLETVADGEGVLSAGEGRTDLFIHPPYRFRAVDRLVTNFHLPRSSLLMLVAAFAGRERVLAAYRHAVEAGYRFYSYGDAMVIL